jgi:hypothetical protein
MSKRSTGFHEAFACGATQVVVSARIPGSVSSAFAVPKLHALGPAERTGPCHHDVWYYAPGPRLWKPVPDGMVPDFSPEFTDKLECLRLNIGLY